MYVTIKSNINCVCVCVCVYVRIFSQYCRVSLMTFTDFHAFLKHIDYICGESGK